jgi:hypothetical protein
MSASDSARDLGTAISDAFLDLYHRAIWFCRGHQEPHRHCGDSQRYSTDSPNDDHDVSSCLGSA